MIWISMWFLSATKSLVLLLQWFIVTFIIEGNATFHLEVWKYKHFFSSWFSNLSSYFFWLQVIESISIQLLRWKTAEKKMDRTWIPKCPCVTEQPAGQGHSSLDDHRRERNVPYLGASLVVQWLRISFQCRGSGFDPWLGN